MGRGRGEGDEEIKCHGKDVMTSVLWSLWQPVPDNGHDIAERPVAPYTSQCLLFVFSPNPEMLCLHRGAERTKWVVSVGNGFVSVGSGTGLC